MVIMGACRPGLSIVIIKNHFSDELVNEYCNYGFLPTLFKGDRGSRIRLMIIDFVCWAETRSDEPVYVLVISKDKNLEEDAKFSTVRELLENTQRFPSYSCTA
ncbi:unnamed protein product [Brassica rapa]|uniref:Uncharacterized protein n=1 Tax=Brassica campestris TaxID=3711 RepID=A0A8D9HQ48_BRACM|nr:unnamed protein product [Brassica rapa]